MAGTVLEDNCHLLSRIPVSVLRLPLLRAGRSQRKSFNRAAELWVGNSRGTNRNDFIRQELLQAHTWTTLMALDQPEPHALLSKMDQHFFGLANDQMQSGGRVFRLLEICLGCSKRVL